MRIMHVCIITGWRGHMRIIIIIVLDRMQCTSVMKVSTSVTQQGTAADKKTEMFRKMVLRKIPVPQEMVTRKKGNSKDKNNLSISRADRKNKAPRLVVVVEKKADKSLVVIG